MYPFISFVEFFNGNGQEYYTTIDFNSTNMDELKRSSQRFISENAATPQNYSLRTFEDNGRNIRVVSMLVKDYADPDHYIIINVAASYLESVLGPPSQELNNVFLVDPEGNIIVDNSQFYDEAQGSSLIQSLEFSKTDSGESVIAFNGEQYVVNYLPASSFDFYIVSAMKHSLATSYRQLYLKICIFSALAFIALGFILVTFTTKIVYAPVKNLIRAFRPTAKSKADETYDEALLIQGELDDLQRKVDKANTIVNKTQKASRTHLLMNLVLEKNLKSTINTLDYYEDLRYFLSPTRIFRVLLFDIDDYREFSRGNSTEDNELYCYGVSNIVGEFLQKYGKPETFVMSYGRICTILSAEREFNIEKKEIENISKECLRYIGCTVSCLIGCAVSKPEKICDSYKQCKEFSQAKFIFGNGCAIDEAVFSEYLQLPMVCSYPYQKNILSLLFKENQYDLLVKNTQEFVHLLSSVQSSAAQNVIVPFVADLRVALKKGSDYLADHIEEADTICKNLENSETMESFQTGIAELLRIVNSAIKSGQTRTTQKHRKLIQTAEQYVNENYSNPSLSLTEIAEVVDVSPGYLGKLFTSCTGKSLVQYISSVRIENAKLKLKTTDKPAFKIAEEVGILNATYFTTLFKNIVGVTPSMYRDENKLPKP